MNSPKIGTTKQPFPKTRPEICVTPSRTRPFTVDCRVIPGWGTALEIGANSWMSWYDPPDWRLTSVSYMNVLNSAQVHGLDGVEVAMLDWESAEQRWKPDFTHFVRLTKKSFEWLAISRIRNNKRLLYTFLDEGFETDWGRSDRLLKDSGKLVVAEEGAYTLKNVAKELRHVSIGAGIFRVRVNGRGFTCLRVIDLYRDSGCQSASEQSILAECYYTRLGQLVLHRRYNGRLWRINQKSPYGDQPWDEKFPENMHLVINRKVFVHWYDCLTDIALGIKT